MTYHRVIPRDLFNEADLLKCLGRLAILLDETHRGDAALIGPEWPTRRFEIEQDESDGSIEVVNVKFKISEFIAPRLFRPLNSREPWALWCQHGDEDIRVFDRIGQLSPEFQAMISQ